jgi:PAS domain S-box-containing protein
MGDDKRTRAAPGSHPSASPKDIELACHSLQEIKQRLHRIAGVGGGAPSQALLVAAADDCADPALVTNDAADIVIANGPAARLLGLSTRELQKLSVWDITHPVSQLDFDVLWREFLRAGRQRGIFSLQHRDGHAVQVAYCNEAHVLPHLHVGVFHRSLD